MAVPALERDKAIADRDRTIKSQAEEFAELLEKQKAKAFELGRQKGVEDQDTELDSWAIVDYNAHNSCAPAAQSFSLPPLGTDSPHTFENL